MYVLQLLSLQGKTTVPVTRLTLHVTEDYGGEAAGDSERPDTAKQADLGELVSSLTLCVGAPPSLQGLLSSLQLLQSSSSTQPPHTALPTPPPQHPAAGEEIPTDISQMIAAFRQLRPASSEQPPPPPPPDTRSEAESCKDDKEMNDTEESIDLTVVSLSNIEALVDRKSEQPPPPPPPDTRSEAESCKDDKEMNDMEESKDLTVVSLSNIEALVDRKIAELEARMRSYVDAKVKAVMNHIEANREQEGTTENRMVNREKSTNRDGSQNGTQNGLLNFEEQLD